MEGRAWMEMDGYLEFQVRLSADAPLAVKDVRLEIPWAAASARYMMGLGAKGGPRPAAFEWSWDQTKNQDSLWLGDVNAGMQVGLRAENYSRPLNTNFYLSKPLKLPPSWWNGGKGRVRVREVRPGVVLYAASSGERTLEPGRDLHFHFILLLTPFKPIDPAAHFATRFMHAYKPVAEVAAAGANTVNIHHANAINPYINYPFLRPEAMKAYVDEAHRRGLRVKIYDTVRELSNRAPEIFALRSLGHEIFTPGPGGGYAWLQEHLGTDYIAAWFVPDLKDAAVINSGMSRWHNFYIEGLDWLARNIGIDGLYLDDVAFDRTTMKRVRKVLDRNRPAPLIDLHSANQYNPRDGFVSSANLYLEHFPVSRPSLVRRVLRLRGLAGRLLAGRGLGHPLRPDGGDAAGRRQSLAGHDLRHDQPHALVGAEPVPAVEGLGRFRPRPGRDERLVVGRMPGPGRRSGHQGDGLPAPREGHDRPGQLGQGADAHAAADRLESAGNRSPPGPPEGAGDLRLSAGGHLRSG